MNKNIQEMLLINQKSSESPIKKQSVLKKLQKGKNENSKQASTKKDLARQLQSVKLVFLLSDQF